MELLTPDSGLFFWMLLSFGIVFFILARYGFPVITNMVDKRKEYIDHSLEAAREANRKLDEVKTESGQLIAKAQEEKTRIINEAIAARHKIMKEAREQAEQDVKKQLEEVQQQIQAQKDEVLRDIRRQVAVLSVDIAEKVVRKDLDNEKSQMEMIDRLLNDISLKHN